ncbi:MAG: outer membrane beta-barrel protein [Gemmatimonadota bacterium]
MQVTPFFRHTLDAVRTIRTIDNAGVTTRTFANVSTSDAYGADLTISLRGRLSGFAGASAFRQVDDVANIDPALNARTFGWTTRTNAAFRVSKTFDLQALVSYRSGVTVEQGRVAGQSRVSLAARKKLGNDRLSLTLRLIDPFNTSVETSTTIDPRFYQVADRRRAVRGLLLNVNWALGNPKAEDEPINLNVP